MSDVIQILPDFLANQIAAGEVVQRPSSVVKELLENAIDAKAEKVVLIIKDGGKSLIQVIDDGVGMSFTDARMAFERHATSKLKQTEDLFNITTKGFRGEALASIGAVAVVELKTKRHEEELGADLLIEGGEVKHHEVVNCSSGCNIAVKNLFFNIPARRKFLKSDSVETKHILDEFTRITLAHPEIRFEYKNNQSVPLILPKTSLRQRIVNLMGNNYNDKLVPIQEDTIIVKIEGFIVKPEYARKTRGEQFLFVNNRFIKSSYLNHAIVVAFDELLPRESHPGYFIKLEVPPSEIDVNIHPTKTEVKFTDEKSIYQIIRSAVKKALGQNNIAPSIDFDVPTAFEIPQFDKGAEIKIPRDHSNSQYNPFNTSYKTFRQEREKIQNNWESLYKVQFEEFDTQVSLIPFGESEKTGIATTEEFKAFRIKGGYIFTSITSGVAIIHQCRAHERIAYERLIQGAAFGSAAKQMNLYPISIDYSAADFAVINQIFSELQSLGFDIDTFGNHSIVVRGIPAGCENLDIKDLLDSCIEGFKNSGSVEQKLVTDKIARTMSKKMSLKRNVTLEIQEIKALVDDLFACEQPYTSPDGKPVIITMRLDELDQKFLR